MYMKNSTRIFQTVQLLLRSRNKVKNEISYSIRNTCKLFLPFIVISYDSNFRIFSLKSCCWTSLSRSCCPFVNHSKHICGLRQNCPKTNHKLLQTKTHGHLDRKETTFNPSNISVIAKMTLKTKIFGTLEGMGTNG